jgi:uncharacterized phage infection (PIP) family protein YhgE
MSSVMVYGALALAAVFAVSFLWASNLARNGRDEAESLRDQVRTANEERTQLETALASAKIDHAQQAPQIAALKNQIAALQDGVRQHSAANQQLRDTLAEADTLKEELRQKLMAEITYSRQLHGRLSSALTVMNEVSQTIDDMAERHRAAVQRLQDSATGHSEQTDPAAPDQQAQMLPGLNGGDEAPLELSAAEAENELPAHPPQTLTIVDDHPAAVLDQPEQSAEAAVLDRAWREPAISG